MKKKYLIQIILLVLVSTLVLVSLEAKVVHPKDIVINVSDIKAGQLNKDNIFEWGGTLILVYKRTQKEIEDLKHFNKDIYIEQSKDFFYASMKKVADKRKHEASYYMLDQEKLEFYPLRSKREDIFVSIALDTYLGALINLEKQSVNGQSYLTTVHGYYYDLAGKSLLKINNHGISNMYIPPHKFSGNTLTVGVQKRLKELKNINLDKLEDKEKKFTGIKKLYYENGNILIETSYKNGIENGMTKWYWPNKQVRHEFPYRNGFIDGVVKEYSKNGSLKSEQPHLKGKKEGVEKNYYPNNKLKTTVLYINGEKEGVEQGYSVEGILYYERVYKNNIPIKGVIFNQDGTKSPMHDSELRTRLVY